ncbi:unnamed protein product [Polarella glacialis]|uniref:Uncharacterized protein n=1 Tax=Polarella glacialis TaxID=89957 RepID=A0A813JZ69_POLGL|nr:unnamed protein product [Polarella glacialis]CAE8690702.1 unnamed protein product [Polarella glacialis]
MALRMASISLTRTSISPTRTTIPATRTSSEGSCLAHRLGTWKVSDTGVALTPRGSSIRACTKQILEGQEAHQRQLKQTALPLPQHRSGISGTQTTLASLVDRTRHVSPACSAGEGGRAVSYSKWTALSSESSEARELLQAVGSVSTSPSPRGPPQLPAAATPLPLPKDSLQLSSPRRHLEVRTIRDSSFRSPRRRSTPTLKDSWRLSVGRNGPAVSSGDVEVQRSVSEVGARMRQEIALSRQRASVLDDEFDAVLDDVAQKAGVEAATGSAEQAHRAGLDFMDRPEASGEPQARRSSTKLKALKLLSAQGKPQARRSGVCIRF